MSLLTAWHGLQFDSPPFLLDEDKTLLSVPSAAKLVASYRSWQEFTEDKNFGRSGDRRLHLGLLPVPFIGDMEKAKVVLLLLNPGLDPADYFGELEVPDFRSRLVDNLRQDFNRREYPFLYLDPSIAWHSGYRYWHGKFQGIIAELAKRWGVTYAEGRLRFSKKVACVELFPYQSVRCSLPERIRRELPSAKLARDYVRDVLKPRSVVGEVLLIVMRQTEEWNLSESEYVVIYKGAETRAAHLTPASRGGRRIVEFLCNLRP